MATPGSHDERIGAIRRDNEARCALHLRDHGRATVSAVAQNTSLSRPTVEAAIARLIEGGLVAPVDAPQVAGGRPARLFEFVSRAGFVAGVDVSHEGIRVLVADLSGAILSERVVDVPTHVDGATRLGRVVGLVREAMSAAEAAPKHLLNVHLALSGWVGADGRLIRSGAYPEWERVDVAGHVSEALGCPVHTDNGVNLAAIAEHRIGSARLVSDMLYVLVDRRIALALVLNGQIRHGSHRSTGALSAESLRQFRLSDEGLIAWHSAESTSGVVQKAADGDPRAKEEVDRFMEGLAELVGASAQLVDPDCIVLGGSLADGGDFVIAPLREALVRASWLLYEPTIVASNFGDEAVVLGALTQAFEHASVSLFGKKTQLPSSLFSLPAGLGHSSPELQTT